MKYKKHDRVSDYLCKAEFLKGGKYIPKRSLWLFLSSGIMGKVSHLYVSIISIFLCVFCICVYMSVYVYMLYNKERNIFKYKCKSNL